VASSPYASALGRIKVQLPEFFGKETYLALANAKDLTDIAKILEASPYGPDVAATGTSYQGAARLEMAINRTFVRRARRALDAAPFAGKPVVAAYLRKWDIQNIGLILASKAQGKPVLEAEAVLISSRELPAGLFAGAMTLDDFRQLLQEPTLEAIAQQLVKHGYGGVVLPRLDAFARSHDYFPIEQALEQEYYVRLLEVVKQFQGDEWNIRLLIQSEIDVRNALLLLKAKDGGLPVERVLERFVDGGGLTRAMVPELYGLGGVPELVNGLTGRFPAIVEGLPAYQATRSLTGFETALVKERSVRELKRMRSYPLSLAILFTYLLLAELERSDLLRILYGKTYGVPPNALQDALVVPKL
jgi:vacuolar-type H+-ATPase subunit C/Vma6